MAKKVMSVRLDEETLHSLETSCIELKKTQAEFISEAIEYYSRYLKILRSGGDLVGVQNPQLIEHTEEQARRAAEILSEAADQLTQNHPGIDFGVHYIADYAAVRLFKDSEEVKNRFFEQAQMMNRAGHSEVMDQNTKRALQNK